MWNHQKLLILFFCIATVCVQSTRAGDNGEHSDKIAEITNLLIIADTPPGRIDYFRFWRIWKVTSDEFIWDVAEEFEERMKKANPNGKLNLNQDQKAKLAYEALDAQAKKFVEKYKKELRDGGNQHLIERIETILNDGAFLDFYYDFLNSFQQNREPKWQAQRQLVVYPIILEEYLKKYPQAVEPDLLSKEQVRKIAEVKNLSVKFIVPPGRINYSYEEWDFATDAFQLAVVKEFEERMKKADPNGKSNLTQDQKAKLAYEALDTQAKQFVENYKADLGGDRELIENLDKILTDGNIFEFLNFPEHFSHHHGFYPFVGQDVDEKRQREEYARDRLNDFWCDYSVI